MGLITSCMFNPTRISLTSSINFLNGYVCPIVYDIKKALDKMDVKDFGTVEIENAMSDTYSVVRSWNLPLLLDFLSKNKHIEYPQNIFELGLVNVRKADKINEYERLAVTLCNEKADFTKIKQVLDSLFSLLNINYKIEETNHNSFIEGRIGRLSVNGKSIAFIGEIHPSILANFQIDTPVAALELNISELFEVINKK